MIADMFVLWPEMNIWLSQKTICSEWLYSFGWVKSNKMILKGGLVAQWLKILLIMSKTWVYFLALDQCVITMSLPVWNIDKSGVKPYSLIPIEQLRLWNSHEESHWPADIHFD